MKLQGTIEQILSGLIIASFIGTIMYFVGHDVAITKMKKHYDSLPKPVCKPQCWTRSIPHLELPIHRIKCPI